MDQLSIKFKSNFRVIILPDATIGSVVDGLFYGIQGDRICVFRLANNILWGENTP